MSDAIEIITDKLYKQGVEKGLLESEKILADAKERAQKIILEAESKGKQIEEDARAKSQKLREHVETELKISFREIVHDFHHKIINMIVYEAVEKEIKATLADENVIINILNHLFQTFELDSGKNEGLDILLPEDMQKTLIVWFEQRIKKEFSKNVTVSFSPLLKGGFQITPVNSSYKIDFSENAFRELFRHYLKPHTRNMLFGE